MKIDAFSVEKYEGLNEDKWRWLQSSEEAALFVLCDGASESFDSRGWAAMLAHDLKSLDDLDQCWLAGQISKYERHWQNRKLGWAQRLAFDRGSFSTILALQISHGKCEVSAIGDTVAFAVNHTEILDSCPYRRADQFQNRPLLLSTLATLNPNLSEDRDDCANHAMLDINGATHVLLLTDAIAHWLMKNAESDGQIRRLLAIASKEEFEAFVQEERKKGLRFDDTTMIRINLEKLPCQRKSEEIPV